MNITNFKKLSSNQFRQKAFLIAEAGYEVIEIEKLVNVRCQMSDVSNQKHLIIKFHNQEEKINLDNFKRVFLVGIGKGSALACISLAKILGKRLSGGIALDVISLKAKSYKLKAIQGTHPLPSKQNIVATQKIIELVRNLKKDDLLITFICGGGSALLCGSEKEMNDSILATKLLTRAGANILELNTIRKHLSQIKGGGLTKLAYPATVISLIVSDVLGNDLSMVASGPTVFDKTTKKDAEFVLKKYNLRSTTCDLRLIETTKNKKYFKKVKNILFLSNREPILAMAKKSKELGFKPKIHSSVLKGEAKNALLPLIKKVLGLSLRATQPLAASDSVAGSNLINRKGAVMLAGGETTVTLKSQKSKVKGQGLGKGGRNMEAVLGAIVKPLNSKFYILNSNLVVMSFASDGRDNTEAAGAIGDSLTLEKAQKLKLNPQEFLDMNDSFNFFKKTGDLIFAEQKTFNVADLMLVLSASKE